MNAINPFPGPANVQGYQSISGSCQGGDQIWLSTGDLMRTVSVVSVPTIGGLLELTLTFNAVDTVSGPVGNKWRHNLMMNLVFQRHAGHPVHLHRRGRAPV